MQKVQFNVAKTLTQDVHLSVNNRSKQVRLQKFCYFNFKTNLNNCKKYILKKVKKTH